VTIGWTQEHERGSASLLQLMVWLTLRCGRGVGRVLLVPITVYFIITARRARLASRAYLARVLGRPPRWREVYRHFFTFAASLLDRPFFLTRCVRDYDVAITGLEHVTDPRLRQRGCILLGSHLGSFEVMRALAEENPDVKVRALMHEGDGASVSLLRRLNPAIADKIITIGHTGTMIQVKEAIDQGEMVGILGDRIARGDKVVMADFLGAPAGFSIAPFVLSALLEVPIVLCFGLHVGGRRYVVHFEPFSDGVRLPRDGRAAALDALVRRYAARLEARCRERPYNWFNFFDFWAPPPPARAPHDPAVTRS
jgi:predicted LPLAT superfamily acyltransferase